MLSADLSFTRNLMWQVCLALTIHGRLGSQQHLGKVHGLHQFNLQHLIKTLDESLFTE